VDEHISGAGFLGSDSGGYEGIVAGGADEGTTGREARKKMEGPQERRGTGGQSESRLKFGLSWD
jgi:hypothetical protein